MKVRYPRPRPEPRYQVWLMLPSGVVDLKRYGSTTIFHGKEFAEACHLGKELKAVRCTLVVHRPTPKRRLRKTKLAKASLTALEANRKIMTVSEKEGE